MIFELPEKTETLLRAAMTKAYRMDETEVVNCLLKEITFSEEQKSRVAKTAKRLVGKIRAQRLSGGSLDAFLSEYDLSSEEGIALMCLAEALLRIPDVATVNRLIRDKVGSANWQAHLGKTDSLFVNAATWGLMLTGKMLSPRKAGSKNLSHVLSRFIGRSSEPLIRKAIGQAMRIMGKQFVMGRTIEEALKRAQALEKRGYRYSYDMLGEAAKTSADALRYFEAYQNAILAISKAATHKEMFDNPGISIKLSALSPRYEFGQKKRALQDIIPRLKILAGLAKKANISMLIDAEEAERLELSLDIFEAVFSDPALRDWDGLGVAVQSYQKRAWYLLDWLIDLGRREKKRMLIRLIKGAYWDTEIKLSQEKGLEGYPVFTRKPSTDVSFLACARKILENPDVFFHPAFATHNAYSVAAILEMVGDRKDFEFQALHGMGLPLYDQIVGPNHYDHPCRIYAPVGGHADLLPYLVRRLLENGANTSFVNRIVDSDASVDQLIVDPVEKVSTFKNVPHPQIPLPVNLYGKERVNSRGLDLTNAQRLRDLQEAFTQITAKEYFALPTTRNQLSKAQERSPVFEPTDSRRQIGWVAEATPEEMSATLEKADAAARHWNKTPVDVRAHALEKAADLIEAHLPLLMNLIIREGGRCIGDSISEVREAADFCRYYAQQARINFEPKKLPGPTGETNELQFQGRGPMLCISPWNFPLAIFTGQMAAALAAGNPAIAKPAKQTPLIAAQVVRLFHEAGVPKDVLQLLPASGRAIGEHLLPDLRIKGVIFTGSTETAWSINRTLAARQGPIVPFIAETGGQNAMIVDSSALLEQVVTDVIGSAFNSAGQRCSALRVLFVQEDIADKFIEMLRGAMEELVIGDPGLLSTDVGPVIDAASQKNLQAHEARMRTEGRLIFQVPLPQMAAYGTFFPPTAFEINNLDQLENEVFGPILHIIRYRARDLDNVINSINATGFGLTLGVHTRIAETASYIHERANVGNCYVNRNMIGAVVGVQPFGGEGLSGTGPKAGGPHYLYRLCTERTLTINTTAAGGNASLMCLDDSE